MRVGLHALGIGTGADPDVISATAIEAERQGFATLWSGEHVVMVDDGASRYPYADDGKIAVPAVADWLDPMITLQPSRLPRPRRSNWPPASSCCPSTIRSSSPSRWRRWIG